MRSTRVSACVPDKGHVERGRGDRQRSAYDQSTIIKREAGGYRDQQLRLPDQVNPRQKTRNRDNDVACHPRRRKLRVHGTSKAASANGYQCVLRATVLIQIESAPAERVVGTHYDDIVLLGQSDPPELRVCRLLIAYRKIGRTFDELPLPFRGIEAERGKPDTGCIGSRDGKCREHPGGQGIVAAENPYGVLPPLRVSIWSVGQQSLGGLAHRGRNGSECQSAWCQSQRSAGSNHDRVLEHRSQPNQRMTDG